MPHTKTMQTFTQPPPADRRIAAVMNRDTRADGSFVYAVRSTGIFCRPSCASRRPRPERIALFDTVKDAQAAGFRACLRCRPERRPAHQDIVQRVCRLIEAHDEGVPSLSELAGEVGLSSHQLVRTFKSAVGMTPKAYADLRRVERLKARLREGGSVTRAMYDAGYASSSRLYEQGAKFIGMTPSDYRKGGRGQRATFTIVDTNFGKLLVAATPLGICTVSLGDSAAALERVMRTELGSAELRRDDAALAPTVRAIVRHVEDGAALGTLATDVRATAFTRAVWKELARIPRGETRTYAQIAAAVGRPKAVRAVAHACATNNLALVIPCHRVVPANGGTGGYRWGSARKRKILERERKSAG